MINLCQLGNLSCFGCCGRDWTTEKEVLLQIGINSDVYKHVSREDFSRRGEKVLSDCGGCKSLIKKDDRVVCGLHPELNDGKDYRDKVCEKNYLCNAFKKFMKWDKKKQDKFVKFILKKKLSNWDYSIGMDSDSFLKEFEKS